ncbi:hypothetical protein L6164_023950 [Bauhinia variegata]|uniref:Uncharacterized protein n=1 Tax=Bauhinia variegata TaxID=167791 RepID=A0ACB9LW89_BAUVA|nr:hypothetical protein L6164_023950 [Bauhinia variegata]
MGFGVATERIMESYTKLTTRKAFRRIKVVNIDFRDLEWTDKIKDCPVYYPSEQEFEDPLDYLQKIANEAYPYGICKIVSPVKASIPADVVLKDFRFMTHEQPLRLSKWNEKDFIVYKRGREYTYSEFQAVAGKAFRNQFDGSEDIPSASYVEKMFWKEMANGKKATVKYGVNLEGSAFSCDPDDKLGKSKWNLKVTIQILGLLGVTDPMLYIGMLFSMFAWHVEDQYLYSISYLHSGACKTWYGVPSRAASDFENTVRNHVYCKDIIMEHSEDSAFELLSKKTTMFPPQILLNQRVPVYKAVQKPGEFVITFPRAYHAGFSHGFNCGEAVNFAVSGWLPFGEKATKRYGNLRMPLVVPFEELLYKGAMQFPNSSTINRFARMYFYKNLIRIRNLPSPSNSLGTICSRAANKRKREASLELNTENSNRILKKH